MRESLSNLLRFIVADLSEPAQGEIVTKYREAPKHKPPRRRPSVKNKSNRTDYMKLYMKKYREDGNDYQKVPEKVKEWRREQKKKLEESKK